ncbi:MAG: D-2-hydroxyacid dehydrogenase [Acidimicrobiales bacterium]
MIDRAGPIFTQRQAAGAISGAYRRVLLDTKGHVIEGDAAGTEVLWRGGRGSRDWTQASISNLADLAWVHSDAVGVETLPVAELARAGVVLTNGAGSFSRPMAEWVILSILAAAKDLAGFVRKSDQASWDPNPQLAELESAVVLLLGLGSVGTMVAEMAIPFGLDVRAAVRRPRASMPPGVSRLIEGPAWRNELAEADYVVVGLPLTDETRHSLDEAAFTAMKQGAWLINVARGAILDEGALVAGLDSGHLGGAVLDSFENEPLPPDNGLWGRPNVIVLPHHTWSSAQAGERTLKLWSEQLGRWAAGRPLINVVDPEAGY